MKIINYYITKLILSLDPNKEVEKQESSIWATLTLFNCYVGYFFLMPLCHIAFGDKIFNSISGKELGLYLLAPLFIFDLFYFFWDTRWLKLYNEVTEWPKDKITNQRNFLIGIFLSLTILSIIYKYYNFSFGRW